MIITVAPAGSAAQLDEIEQSISDSFSVWAGVTGTTFNSVTYPGFEAPIARVTNADSCTDDAGDNVDGLNTICFNQSSDAFTAGVLALTRTFVANAPGVTVGASGPSIFADQILDADTLFCNTGEVTFAPPAAPANTQDAPAGPIPGFAANGASAGWPAERRRSDWHSSALSGSERHSEYRRNSRTNSPCQSICFSCFSGNVNRFVGYWDGRRADSGAGCRYRRNRCRHFFLWKLQRGESADAIRWLIRAGAPAGRTEL